jgi:hypothetical protein
MMTDKLCLRNSDRAVDEQDYCSPQIRQNSPNSHN